MSKKDSNGSDSLYVGIDLGTSQSSISASNGERHVVRSFVGWPVDMVARKLVKSQVLVGQDALDNRSFLDLHRPLQQGLIREGSEKDLAAVRELIRHLLAQVGINGSKDRPTVRAVVGVPAEAMRVNKQQLRNAMKGMVDNLLIVSEPFAVAYGQEALLHRMIVDIGAGTTDFCVMKGRYPGEEDQRTLTSAGDSIDDQLMSLVQERYPEASFSVHMVREWKESHSFVGTPGKRVKVKVPVKGKPTEIDITAELRTACESLLPPVTEAVIDLLTRVEPEYQERVRHGVVLSGCSAQINGLREALEEGLEEVGGGKVEMVEDPVFAGSEGGLALAKDASEAEWERLLQ